MIKQSKPLAFIFIILIPTMFTSCGFAYKEHIVGNYYIIGVDTRDEIHLSYSLPGGAFVGKAPGVILEYGFNDSVLIAKTKEHRNSFANYYIIDRRKDFDVALEENFRIGPVSESDYDENWKSKFNIQLPSVKN